LRYFGYLLLGIVVAAFAYGSIRTAHQYWIGWTQNRCAIGTVSNEHYREWLQAAKELRRSDKNRFGGFSRTSPAGPYESNTNIRFDRLTTNVSTLDERLAAMHAMLRSEGFVLRAVLPDSLQPFEIAPASVRYRYTRFIWAGLIYACAVGCEERVFATFYLRDGGLPRATKNNFDISSVYEPSPEVGPWRPDVPETASPACPPTPSREWTKEFFREVSGESSATR
jgi:hypothetical protein